MNRELKLRIITAVVLFSGALLWLFVVPDRWFDMILGCVAVAATVELLRMVDIPHRRFFSWLALLAWAVLVLTHGEGLWFPLILVGFLLSWFVLLAVMLRDAADLPMFFHRMLYAQWMMLWLFLFVFVLLQLHAHAQGVALIAGACVGVWLSDIAAYFTGKAWGKDKLCPGISPGKTWQGLAGGVFAGVLGAMLVWVFWAQMSWAMACFLAIVLVCSGIVGDLAESALKRVVGVKDSGRMLPGHGGLLDRIDALLPSLPLVGLLWLLFVA